MEFLNLISLRQKNPIKLSIKKWSQYLQPCNSFPSEIVIQKSAWVYSGYPPVSLPGKHTHVWPRPLWLSLGGAPLPPNSVHVVQVELKPPPGIWPRPVNHLPPVFVISSGQISDPNQADLNQWRLILGLLGGTLRKISAHSYRFNFSRTWTHSSHVEKARLGKKRAQKRAESEGKTYRDQDCVDSTVKWFKYMPFYALTSWVGFLILARIQKESLLIIP